MKVVGRDKLVCFWERRTNSQGALEAWFDEVSRSTWSTPQDIRNRHRGADFLANNRVIFNIKGNHYRLVVKVRYQQGLVVIEWVGTHAEYNKQRF